MVTKQHMLVFGQTDQPAANQRTCFQVKGRSRFQFAEGRKFRFDLFCAREDRVR